MRTSIKAMLLLPLLLLGTTSFAQTYFNYGGGFQVDDCNRNNVNNSTTGTLSCPSGTYAYYTGRILGPESRCGGKPVHVPELWLRPSQFVGIRRHVPDRRLPRE